MSEIALYEVLKQIPDVTDEQAKAAVSDVAKKEEVATKLDIVELKAELKTDIAKLETTLTWRLVIGLGVVVAILKFL